ncbi:hypothetical protein LIER_16530 [Lithospermum erythrorhizon]|uniref:Uncharacterized protein n=1 Tax=Lithospermum erythrorhizon TaxID=34254 RepID=A0AAV3Q8V3_LITER
MRSELTGLYPLNSFCRRFCQDSNRGGEVEDRIFTCLATRVELLSLKNSSGECVMPHIVNFNIVTTEKDLLARISKLKSAAVSESSTDVPSLAPVSKKSRKTTKKNIPEDAPVITEVIPETFNPPSPDLLPHATTTIPDHNPALDMVTSGRESSPIVPSPKASSSSSGDLLGVPYSLPSAEMTTLEKRLSEVIKERDEARAQAEDLRNKHADLQAICNRLVKFKSDLSCKHEIDIAIFKSSLEEFEQLSRDLGAQLNSSQQLLLDSEKQLEQLSARPPPEVVIERFKEG